MSLDVPIAQFLNNNDLGSVCIYMLLVFEYTSIMYLQLLFLFSSSQ